MKKTILILAVAGGLSLFACDNRKENTETANDMGTGMEDNTMEDTTNENTDMGMDTTGTTIDTTSSDVGM